MAVGRPTKYNEEIIEKTKKFIESCEEAEKQQKIKLPTVNALAINIGIAKSTIWEWKKQYPEFEFQINRLKTIQESMLINNGLSGKYNATITKLILSNNHGYKERKDTTTNGQSTEQVHFYLPDNGRN